MTSPWRRRLPHLRATLDHCAREWGLDLGPPFPGLSFNYTAPARLADGAQAVLKLCPPDAPEFATEVAALRAYGGRGAVRLLAADAAAGALLLERAVLGTALPHGPGAEVVVAQTMARLQQAVVAPQAFPTVADWGRRAFAGHRARYGGPGPLPGRLVEEAEATLAETPAAPCLLHGDLHHANLLAATREPWLAIDPKGVVGDAAFDAYAFLHNPVGVAIQAGAQRRRADALAEALGMERARIRRWARAGIVLSAVWTLSDPAPSGTAWRHALACAEALAG